MASPNVLCISVDSLRADSCSVIDPSLNTTPFLESFADECAVYRRAISPSTWTLPVHTSVFTGLYPQEHQINDEGVQLGDHPTFAELLRERGYSVRSFGHNGWLEQGGILRGFDHVHTPKYGPTPTGLTGLVRRGWRNFQEVTFRAENEDRYTVDKVAAEIENESDPLCYFVHLQGVHYPYHPHIKTYRRFGNLSTYGLYRIFRRQNKLYNSRMNRFLGQYPVSDGDVAHFKDSYRACIHEADQLIGEIITVLQHEGLLEDTVVVIFGDHGDAFGTDGIFGHNFTVSDEVIRVPLLVADPTGRLEPGTHDEIVQLNDIYPTILDAADCELPKTRSQSLYSKTVRDSAFVYYSAPESMWTDMRKSLPDGNDDKLMDLLGREQHLVWKEEQRKLAWYPLTDRYEAVGPNSAQLHEELAEHRDSLQPVQPTGAGDISEDVLENLSDMGYL